MFSCSLDSILDLWVELCQALTGEHGYGGHTAEIYAYRFEQYEPRIHRRDLFKAPRVDDLMVHQYKTASSLVAIVNHFCRRMDGEAKINGLPPDRWLSEFGKNFDWRCYVEIQPIYDCENPDCLDHGDKRTTQKAGEE